MKRIVTTLESIKETFGLLGRKQILILSLLLVGAVFLTVSAYQGEKVAVISLGVFAAAIAILGQLHSALCEDVLDTSRESLEMWTREHEHTKVVTADYIDMLGNLYNLDPALANKYQERFVEEMRRYAPEIDGMMRAAEMN